MSIVAHLYHLFNPRKVSILHPYVALERSALTMSPLSEPQHRPVGYIPRPAGSETLPL